MSKSILTEEKKCFWCGTTYGLHKHHIFGGDGRRKLSEEEGCWTWVCGRHHNLSNESVHHNRDMDLTLKKVCQARWEYLHDGDREKFIKIFSRSYL